VLCKISKETIEKHECPNLEYTCWLLFKYKKGDTSSNFIEFIYSTSPICTLIFKVTGAVKSGSLVAMIGGSGAGKSTLMAALAYRNPG
jgi:ABC-type transport system involved in cytochrome bd biosynthesis fused ATPase/permease subunit